MVFCFKPRPISLFPLWPVHKARLYQLVGYLILGGSKVDLVVVGSGRFVLVSNGSYEVEYWHNYMLTKFPFRYLQCV